MLNFTGLLRLTRVRIPAVVIVLGFTSGWVFSASIARAELPDSTYKKRREEAPELLYLRVDRVTVTENGEDIIRYSIEATVQKVDRSKANYVAGNRVTFQSYYVRPEAWNRGFVGPKSPPQLYPGWTGWIFLDQARDGKGLGPAAYGRSFHYHCDQKVPAQVDNQGGKPRIGKAKPVSYEAMARDTALRNMKASTLLLEKGDIALMNKFSDETLDEAIETTKLMGSKDWAGLARHYEKCEERSHRRLQQATELKSKR